MKRRDFIRESTVGAVGLGYSHSLWNKSQYVAEAGDTAQVTQEGNRVDIYSKVVTRPIRVILAADTHLWLNDERGDPYREFSDRMAGAYNQTTHFQTGEKTDPTESFERTIQLAVEANVDLLALPGDTFSWPSEAAIEWVYDKLSEAGIPFVYVAGNHDWHYEGMRGSLDELRNTWIQKRLLPMYQGNDPLMAAYDIQGIRFLAMDNSTYEISDRQLAFFKDHVKSGAPLILLVHIPLYMPGKPVSFGCGHPEWNADTDRNYEIERRPRWPVSGHTATTMAFYREVFTAPNLMGVFSGHIHRPVSGIVNGKFQFVADDNASGAYLDIHFHPLSQNNAFY